MELEFQAGPLQFRTQWKCMSVPQRSAEIDKYTPVPSAQRFSLNLSIEPSRAALSLPRGPVTENPDNWRAWEEGGGVVLQVWSGHSNSWAIEARITSDFSAAAIICRSDHDQHDQLEFLLATVLRWITSLRVTLEGGVLLHGALIGFTESGVCVLGTGPSGAGKSTLSSFFLERRSFAVWTDETTIVLPFGKSWHAFGTPWSGMLEVAKNEGGKLGALCFLEKAPEHCLETIGKEQAYLRIVKELYLPPWRETFTERALENLQRLIDEVPSRVLYFSKSPSVVDFLSEELVKL